MGLGDFRVPRISWHDLAVTLGPYVLLVVVAFWIAFRFVRPAPPDTITITSGPPGSQFQVTAERYRQILSREGVTLRILPSKGSLDNIKRLTDPKVDVDVGFVQGGLANLVDASELMSLGSLFYEPVLIFYRSPRPISRLSELAGKRIAIGREGSGTRVLAETLLKANGIDAKGPATFLALDGKDAEAALLADKADAAFLTGDSATAASMSDLIHTKGIRFFDFGQADAYVRRFRYLSKVEVPPGSFDLGKNLPDKPTAIIAATAELIARTDLHPALSDLLIEAAREVNGRATVLQNAHEFPAPLEHEYTVSDDALRYYRTGKTFAYRHLPFWLASLVDRAVILLVPVAVLLIPGLKIVPLLYSWRINARIYRRYGELMALEREASAHPTGARRDDLIKRLDEIEQRVITGKLPGAFADQSYVLRQHIDFVRNQLNKAEPVTST